MKMVGKAENWLIFARLVGDAFKLTSIASLPFETVLAHVGGGREWCLGPTNKSRYFKGLSSVAFLS